MESEAVDTYGELGDSRQRYAKFILMKSGGLEPEAIVTYCEPGDNRPEFAKFISM